MESKAEGLFDKFQRKCSILFLFLPYFYRCGESTNFCFLTFTVKWHSFHLYYHNQAVVPFHSLRYQQVIRNWRFINNIKIFMNIWYHSCCSIRHSVASQSVLQYLWAKLNIKQISKKYDFKHDSSFSRDFLRKCLFTMLFNDKLIKSIRQADGFVKIHVFHGCKIQSILDRSRWCNCSSFVHWWLP